MVSDNLLLDLETLLVQKVFGVQAINANISIILRWLSKLNGGIPHHQDTLWVENDISLKALGSIWDLDLSAVSEDRWDLSQLLVLL